MHSGFCEPYNDYQGRAPGAHTARLHQGCGDSGIDKLTVVTIWKRRPSRAARLPSAVVAAAPLKGS